MLNIDKCASFASEATLRRALLKRGLADASPVVVCNTKGRLTAIFGYATIAREFGGNVAYAARQGFLTIS